MIKKLQKKYALSEQGAKDLIKGCLACVLQNLSFMFPVGLLYYLVSDLMNGGVPGGKILFYVAGFVMCIGLILLTTFFQYNATYFATYKESGIRRITLAEHLRKIPLSFFGKKDLADLTSTSMADCTFLEQACKGIGSLHQAGVIHISTHNDTARVQIVVQSFRLTQELRAENDVVAVVLFTHRSRESDRNRGLNDHDGIWIVLHHQLNDRFDRAGVKEILSRIIIGRRRNNDEVRVLVRRFRIHRRRQIQCLLCQVLLDIVILDRRLSMIHHVHLFWDDIHCHHMIVLRKKRRQRQTHIHCTSYRNIH